MKQYEEQEINRSMWICQVTEFVFGHSSTNFRKKRMPWLTK